MKRNFIRLSLLAVVGGVGWFAISHVRQSWDQAPDQELLSSAVGTEYVAESESQRAVTVTKQGPVLLESGPTSPIARGQEPSRYNLQAPPPDQLQAMTTPSELPSTLPAGNEAGPGEDTLPIDETDARLPDEVTPPAMVRDAPINHESAGDDPQLDQYALSPETESGRYGQSLPGAPDSFRTVPAREPPLSTVSPLALTSEGARADGRDSSQGDDNTTLRGQDTLLATDPSGRYPADNSDNRGFPSPQEATGRLNQVTDRQDAEPSFAPSAFPARRESSQGSFSTQDSNRSQAETVGSDAGTGRPGGEQLEGAQTPGLTLQKFAPAEIQIGKECTFTIKVRNTGQIAAHGVELHDEIPYGTRLVSTKPPAERGPRGELVWALGTLGIGEEATAELRLMPTAEGEIGSVATLRFEAQASVRTISTKPELALRLSAPHQVMIGKDVTVQIEIGNPGSGATTGIMLMENVPEGLSHPAGQALEFEIGKLEPGETRQLELVLTAEAAGQIVNTLIARADAGLNVQESVELQVVAPELEVSVEGPKRRYLERQASYTVSVDNPGTAAAKEVELVTRLPKGMKFVKANNSGLYDASTHSVYWSLAELPAGQQGTVKLVAVPVESGELTLNVEGRADQGLQSETKQTTLVEGIAAIMFEVVDLADPIEVGGKTTYEVRVVNQGSKAATNVRIMALIPPGMSAVSAGGPTKYAIQGGRVLFEPLRRLAPKADTTYRIQVQGDRPGDQRIRVQILTDEVTQPVTKEESTRVYADE